MYKTNRNIFGGKVCMREKNKVQNKVHNKVLGNNFEKEMAQILKDKGFWVHLITPARYTGSQPADIIAVKDNKTILIDCKTCSTNLFPLSRVEQNQRLAYKRFKECGNTEYFLAIKYDEKIYLVPLEVIDFDKKYIDLKNEWIF